MPLLLSRRHHRLVALTLIVPALVLRALIPVGFMPTSSADTVIELRMCSITNPSAVRYLQIDSESVAQVVDSTEPVPLDHGDDYRTPCDFAVLSCGAAPPVYS